MKFIWESVCRDIERRRKFIWEDSCEKKKKIHLIKWEFYQPKTNGGLDIRNMHTMNEAFIKKLGWGLVSDYNSFWVSILRGKYAIKL